MARPHNPGSGGIGKPRRTPCAAPPGPSPAGACSPHPPSAPAPGLPPGLAASDPANPNSNDDEATGLGTPEAKNLVTNY